MVKIKKSYKAFTIIELLVVMGIIGVLLTMGIYSMVQLRRITEADQAVKEMISAVKETKNRAKNNTINTKETTDLADLVKYSFGYLLQFDTLNAQFYRSTCRKLSADTWSTTSLACFSDKEPLKKDSFSNISFRKISGNCDGALLENLSEKMYLVNGTAIVAGSTCEVDVIFKDDNTMFRKIMIDAQTGNITVTN